MPTGKRHWHGLFVVVSKPQDKLDKTIEDVTGNILRGSARLQKTMGLSLFSLAPKIS